MAINFYSDIYLAANKLGRDADNLLDFSTDNEITFRVGAGDGVVFKASGEIEATKFDGALEGNADTATLATTATHVTVTDNASTDENNRVPFIEDTSASGNVGLESDNTFYYNPSSGTVSATVFNGEWQGTAIASAYLDTDTAHLTTAQTFTGVKTFGTTTKLQFRDANAYINSPTANDIEIAATTITLDAASDIQLEQDTTVTGDLTVSEDTTVTGNLTVSGSVTHDFNATTFENQLADDVGSGKIIKYSPGADDTLVGSQIYFLHTDGTWDLVDADAVATGGTQMLGVGLQGSARTVGVFIEGFIRIASTEILNTPGSGAVDGLPLYVSTTDGHFDFTAPSGSGDYVRIVGYAIDDDGGSVLVYFDPSKDHIVLA